MNPSELNAIALRSWIERRQGDFEAILNSRQEARKLDPRNPVLIRNLLNGLLVTHRFSSLTCRFTMPSGSNRVGLLIRYPIVDNVIRCRARGSALELSIH